MEGPGLPETETKPEIEVFFLLVGGVEGETIGAGMLQGFAAVHAFVQDEKCKGASHLVGVVSSDFLHAESFLEVSPVFPLAPFHNFFRKK